MEDMNRVFREVFGITVLENHSIDPNMRHNVSWNPDILFIPYSINQFGKDSIPSLTLYSVLTVRKTIAIRKSSSIYRI